MRAALLFVGVVASVGGRALAAEPAAPRVLFINGGASVTSNFSFHENDILTFMTGLFGQKPDANEFTRPITLLNAGGKGTKVVAFDKDGMMRTPAGDVVLKPTSVTYPQGTANKPQALAAFRALKDSGLGGATVVVGDHGDKGGMSLWNEGSLSARELLEEEKKFPVSLVVRRLHLHCHAGASLVDADRKLPPTDPEKFLGEHYRANSCGLALGMHDELGDYFGAEGDWKDNEYTRMFKGNKKFSIAAMKKSLAENPAFGPTPVTTSDYVVRDLASYFCSLEGERPAAPAKRPSEEGHTMPSGRAEFIVRYAAATPCEAFVDPVGQQLDKDLVAENGAYTEAIGYMSALADQYLARKSPRLALEYETKMKAIEALKAAFVLKKGKATAEEEAELERKTEALREGTETYERELLSIEEGFKDEVPFENFRRSHEMQDWRKQKEIREKFARGIAALDGVDGPSVQLVAARASVAEKFHRKREARKDHEVKMQALRRTYVLKKLGADPNLKKVREFYESIVRCEDSPLS